MAEIRYAATVDGVHVAYRAIGAGPVDIVFISWLMNVEQVERWRRPADVLGRLGSFARIVILDRRGTGLSDRAVDRTRHLTLEARMDDIRAVMDDLGIARAVLLGAEDGFPVAATFAATYPERTSALVGYGAVARTVATPDYPWGRLASDQARLEAEVNAHWGTPELAARWLRYIAPDWADDPEEVSQFAAWMRNSLGPGDARSMLRVDRDIDVRDVLPTIGVPSLIIHRSDDAAFPVGNARFLAERIPGARLVEVPGRGHGWPYEPDGFVEAVRRFVGSVREEEAAFERVLATILFTDIASSTERAAAIGDRSWRDVVERHHGIVRAMLARYRGVEVDTAGDGFFATFDGPARAVRCAESIVSAVRPLGIEVKAGVHTGEVETIDGKIGGLAVSIGARVAALAAPSEVVVSSTVKDLVAGSGIVFEDHGEHDLRGVPDRWHLYRIRG